MKFETVILLQSLSLNRESTYHIKSSSSIPTSFILNQNYPNPFKPMTTQKLDIPPIFNKPPARSGGKGVFLNPVMFDTAGSKAAILLSNYITPGKYLLKRDASNYALDCISASWLQINSFKQKKWGY